MQLQHTGNVFTVIMKTSYFLWTRKTRITFNDMVYKLTMNLYFMKSGGVAQMVERSLSMREVPGSIPGASIPHFKLILDSYILSIKVGSIFTHKLFVSI